MKNNIIQCFEYSTLKVGDYGFKENHFVQLVHLNETHQNKYFTIGHKRIYFKQYVGVIQVGNLTIEILPKADNQTEDKSKWQSAFITMLRESGLLNVDAPTEANLRLRNISIMDLFIERFINEVEKLVHLGLIKKYRTIEDNSYSLKGKIIFNKNLKLNLIHKERFYNKFQVYDKNNLFNQIITKAVRLIPFLTISPHLLSKTKNLLTDLESISDLKITEDIFDKITFDRKTNPYKNAILISKMILLNYSPDIKSGSDHILSLLFDMNEVFEKFIYRRLKREEEAHTDLRLIVRSQLSKEFWNRKKIRPDILIEYVDNATQLKKKVILDTKWKILKSAEPTDSDLKQMYSYNLHFGANQSYLVYPKVYDIDLPSGYSHESLAVNQEYKNHTCNLYFAEMFDDMNELSKTIGNDLLEKIL